MRFADSILFYALRALALLSRLSGRKGRVLLGRRIGRLLSAASKKRRGVTLENIVAAYPGSATAVHGKIMNDSYENLGITLAELLAFPKMSDSEAARVIRYENIELLREAQSRGKGLLLLSGHYGNWELLAYSAGLFSGIPITIVVQPQKNKLADRLLNKYRTQRNNKVIDMGNAARGIIQALRQGEAVAMLVDQSATFDRDIFVDFFGRPAATYEAPASIALRYRCPVIIGFAERQDDGSYYVRLQEIPHDDLQNNREGIAEFTRRHVRILEEAIRRRPGLWSWQHRRWKHSDKV